MAVVDGGGFRLPRCAPPAPLVAKAPGDPVAAAAEESADYAKQIADLKQQNAELLQKIEAKAAKPPQPQTPEDAVKTAYPTYDALAEAYVDLVDRFNAEIIVENTIAKQRDDAVLAQLHAGAAQAIANAKAQAAQRGAKAK